MKKMRSDNPLASLSEAQLDEIYDWLHEGQSYKDVRARLASPPPDGFSIKVSIPALCRFYKERRVEERVADTLQLAVVPADDPAQTHNLHHATSQAIAHVAYETAHSPETAKSFAILANWLTRHEYNEIQRQNLEVAKSQYAAVRERLDLSRQRLRLDTLKVQINIARKALEHAARLQAILANDKTDDEDKIHEARGLLCGNDFIPTPEKP